jgi:hypothetical protein
VKLGVIAAGAVGLAVSIARRADAFGLAIATAVVGPLVEIALVRAGAFRHLRPDLFGIPMWLPALYACASLSFGALVNGTLGSRPHH